MGPVHLRAHVRGHRRDATHGGGNGADGKRAKSCDVSKRSRNRLCGDLYGVFALVYLFPALKLWNYANSIENLMSSGTVPDLEAALNEQRSFWKYVGILAVILLSLNVVMIGIVVIGGMSGVSGNH